jgi:shikimate 5-dehydrogenase
VTKLLHAAKQLDLTQANGLSMLVHQATQALELWTQEEICVAAMYQGVAENH